MQLHLFFCPQTDCASHWRCAFTIVAVSSKHSPPFPCHCCYCHCCCCCSIYLLSWKFINFTNANRKQKLSRELAVRLERVAQRQRKKNTDKIKCFRATTKFEKKESNTEKTETHTQTHAMKCKANKIERSEDKKYIMQNQTKIIIQHRRAHTHTHTFTQTQKYHR